MSDPVTILQDNQRFLYLIEIGALLHDVGKLWTRFLARYVQGSAGSSMDHGLVASARPETGQPYDPDMAQTLRAVLNQAIGATAPPSMSAAHLCLNCFIAGHHPALGSRLMPWLRLLRARDGGADGIASGDDKGTARARQDRDGLFIATAFGWRAERVAWNGRAKAFSEIDTARAQLYSAIGTPLATLLDGSGNLEHARHEIIEAVHKHFLHGLGETRLAANDVTLWDHAWACAAMVKATAAETMIREDLPEYVEGPNAQVWRLLGVAWPGREFVLRGRKIADIQTRLAALGGAREAIRATVEDTIPCGALVYQDVDSVFFTFPALRHEPQKLHYLAEAVADQIDGHFRTTLQGELCPTVTLSAPSWTMTAIQHERDRAVGLARVPVQPLRVQLQSDVAPGQLQEAASPVFCHIRPPSPPLGVSGEHELCPSCHRRFVRPGESDPDMEPLCRICAGRRRGRAEAWAGELQGPTIWLDELKDDDNRIALIWAAFDLRQWLDGTRLYEQFAQTPVDWATDDNTARAFEAVLHSRGVGSLPSDRRGAHREATALIEQIVAQDAACREDDFAALQTLLGGEHFTNVEEGLIRLEGRGPHERGGLTAEDYLTLALKTHPSPARLMRVWRTTQRFLQQVDEGLNELAGTGRRMVLTLESAPQGENVPGAGQSCDDLTLVAEWTAAEGRHQGEITGASVYVMPNNAREWVVVSGDHQARLSREGSRVTEVAGQRVTSSVLCDPYPRLTPIISDDPLLYQVLVPADKAWDVVKRIRERYTHEMAKVQGKLPLHLGLLIFKHRMPLYVALECAERMRHGLLREEPVEERWTVAEDPADAETLRFTNGCEWALNRKYGGAEEDYYHNWWRVRKERATGRPTFKPPGSDEWRLCHVADLEKDDTVAVNPGYFDFALLLNTAQRLDLTYQQGGNGRLRRARPAGGREVPRPYYLEDVDLIAKVWARFDQHLTSTQLKQLQRALDERAEAYSILPDDGAKHTALLTFGGAVLAEAFGDAWSGLPEPQKQLLDTCLERGILTDIIYFATSVLKLKPERGS